MRAQADSDAGTGSHVRLNRSSAGRRPGEALVAEAHERYKSDSEGANSQVYPALARCRASCSACAWSGPAATSTPSATPDYEFSIMSVSKPFVFALVCQSLGAEQVREKLGVNSTGLPFNSLAAVERSTTGGRTRW